MDPKFSPTAFIYEAANTGLATVAALSSFSSDRRIKDLAATMSLSASLLSEIGRTVDGNEGYFKSDFVLRFEKLIDKCKKKYEMVLAGLEKANSWKKLDSAGATEPAKKRWEKLQWALDMKADEIHEFEDSLNESYNQVSMLQSVVMLVILQMHAQERDLTPTEQAHLFRLRKCMGKLLEALRDADVASVVAFSLAGTVKLADTAQVAEAGESSINDTSSTMGSITIHNPSEENIIAAGDKKPDIAKDLPCAEEKKPEPRDPDIFEMHRASYNSHWRKGQRTTFRLFGIPIKIDRSETDLGFQFEKVPATGEEIKVFLEKAKAERTVKQPSTFESLVNIPPAASTAIYALVNSKTDTRPYQSHKWSIECLIPMLLEDKPRRRIWTRKGKSGDGYILILRGESRYRQFCPGPPPPPLNWPGQRPVVGRPFWRKPVKEAGPAAQIDLTQRETEMVINDFLASFSTLYDGIRVEERGAALRAIKEITEDDLDYDSDDSSSSGTQSLVDD